MTELFINLYRLNLVKDHRWWPGYGTFEVVVGAILTQNTKWQNVEKALEALKKNNSLTINGLLNLTEEELATLIKPSGFYNQKAKRLKGLIEAMSRDFGDFESFKKWASKEWLSRVKGLGAESVDSILCYACEKNTMVVDRYAMRVLSYLGYEFQSYEEAKEQLESIDYDFVVSECGVAYELIFALFHGLIVEFCKLHLKKGEFDDSGRAFLDTLKF